MIGNHLPGRSSAPMSQCTPETRFQAARFVKIVAQTSRFLL
jgi:hypothetical protein